MKKLFLSLLLFTSLSVLAQPALIPAPRELQQAKGTFVLSNSTRIIAENKTLNTELNQVKELLQAHTGFRFDDPKGKTILALHKASSGDQLPAEGYKLKVSPNVIDITASDASGFFYAAQTLLQLLPAEGYKGVNKASKLKINCLTISDWPELAWRGVMLDVSRQFYQLSYLKKYIDWIAMHKLNIFHLHLTDDEGWRVEIKAYPKLTELGAWRGPSELLPPAHGSGDKRYGGFYTQDELRELVKYASARQVQIIPEIDVPGHSRSVAVAYPEILCQSNDTTGSAQGVKKNVWCTAREANYEMLDKIIGEIAAIFPSDYIHIGGDEVNHKAWEKCPLCTDLMHLKNFEKSSKLQNYFIGRIEEIVAKHGKKMIGWDEILASDTLRPETSIMVWTSENAARVAAKKNLPVILSPSTYLYLDMAQGMGERGHSWATFLPAERILAYQLPADLLQNKNIRGIQGNLWAEYLDKPFYQTDYQSYPRLCALAELGWNGNRTDYSTFEKRMNQSHYERLYQMGIRFRAPAPIVNWSKGKLKVQPINGFETQYCQIDTTNALLWKKLDKKQYAFNDLRSLRFRNVYRDSITSMEVALAYDTISAWNPQTINMAGQDSIISLNVNANNLPEGVQSLMFRYRFGRNQLQIKKISLYNENGLQFEKTNEKPVTLFTRSPEWEVALPANTIKKNGKYRLDIKYAGRKPEDSFGIVFIQPTK